MRSVREGIAHARAWVGCQRHGHVPYVERDGRAVQCLNCGGPLDERLSRPPTPQRLDPAVEYRDGQEADDRVQDARESQ